MLHLLILLLFLALFLGVWIPVRKKQCEKKHLERLETISRLAPDVEAALAGVCTFYSYSHYINESERIP